MVPSSNSVDLARRLPNAQLTLYKDAGHGGIFQYHEEFVPRVLEFLKSQDAHGRTSLRVLRSRCWRPRASILAHYGCYRTHAAFVAGLTPAAYGPSPRSASPAA
jgi:hypothetical protein